MRNWALAISVFTAALIAHPSFERPWHGPHSSDVAEVIEYRFDDASWTDWDVDCRQAIAKRVYDCDAVDDTYESDTFTESYRVTLR